MIQFPIGTEAPLASRTITTLIDDLDGGEADENLQFGIDGVEYEIDLTNQHADELRQLFDAYIQAGRRTGGRKSLNGSPGSHKSGQRTILPSQGRPLDMGDRHALQRFARANGYKVPAERGRVSRELVKLWEEAGKPT